MSTNWFRQNENEKMPNMTNQLAKETSPYLLQHAENPVDWFSWGPEILEKAKTENKPILLSIGYSSCHWCHVMARESFEDSETAEAMNQNYINIKVDREERPDLDKIYQQAFQLLNKQGGGWPLTMFLDPQTLIPFFGGTYFPKTARYQLPGFIDLLMRVSETFNSKKDELEEQGEKILTAFAQMKIPPVEPQLENLALLAESREKLGKQYEPQFGGFSQAPKFPTPTKISKLLKHWSYQRKNGSTDKDGLEMVMSTLTQMARGGIYDHLGGGFFRYSTDAKWMIPHFEKMLYDNGQLLALYSYALRFGPDQLFEDAITETIEWITRDMRDPLGGFYASVDAESDKEEGSFYTWRREEVKSMLSENQYLLIETLYGLDKPSNFENRWNLHRNDSWRSVVSRLQLDEGAARNELIEAKALLFKNRLDSPAPNIDKKVLTSWNAVTIKGIIESSTVISHQNDWLDLATDALDFIHDHLWDGDTLFATWTGGYAKHHGYLDDYANLLDALLVSLRVRWRDKDAMLAKRLADSLIERFYDEKEGGFFFTAHDQEQLFHRPKPSMDYELPSGNGIAAKALNELGNLMGSPKYIEAAAGALKWARAALERFPTEHSSLIESLEEQTYPPQQVVIRGPEEEISAWQESLDQQYTPWRKTYCIPYTSNENIPSYLPSLISAEKQRRPLAYVCTELSCSLPIDSLEELKEALK